MQVLFDRNQIAQAVHRLAGEINDHYLPYNDRQPVLVVGILNGAFPFLADLMRSFEFPVEIDLMRISSYGSSHVSSGVVQIKTEPDSSPQDRRVLIVEDIIDTGRSMAFLYDYFKQRQAREIRSVVLLDKFERREIDIHCDHVGFQVANLFVAGYGLDAGGFYRHLPDIQA
ncbi:MAG: hypoxanthine phosphoribosyltransferase [Thermoguttaceae bacterium]|nr:hypoxanthine phosphoribosyltransferase [Thermoguttaceae bacterium]